MGTGVGDNHIEDQGETGWKEQSEGTGTGEKSKRGAFGVPGRKQHGHEKSAQRENGDARCTRERGKEGTDQSRHNGWASSNPPKTGLKHLDQSFGSASLREEVACQGEERNAGKGRVGH